MVSKNPVYLGYDDPVNLKFENAIEALDIKLRSCTPEDELLDTVVRAVLSTWEEGPDTEISDIQKVRTLRNVFKGNTIPAAKRFINMTWSFNNISMQEVTHILRYQTWDFIAQCSDTISWRDKTVLVPDGIMNSPELYERFKKLANEAVNLYADALDTREVSLLDSRRALIRAMSTFYWVHNDFQSAQKFIYDRLSEEFQPQEDNVIAMQMALQIEKAYPLATCIFDLDRVDAFYLSMITDHGRTFQPRPLAKKRIPDEMLDELDFAYDKQRNEYRGTSKPDQSAFEKFKKNAIEELKDIENDNRKLVKDKYGIALDELDAMPSIV